jgi:HAD superfamily hydrolase (TIGR01509 family)
LSLTGFVFDFDGTLIDTETAGFDAVRDVFREYGAELTVEFWAPFVGASVTPDFVGELERQLRRSVNAQHVVSQVRSLNTEYVANAALRPGVAALIDDAVAHGLGLAVASNAPRDWIEMNLSRVGLLRHFGVIMSLDDVRNPKPHPEPFDSAARAIGLNPTDCVAFEDSNLGVHSAVAAGMFTVAVPGALTGHIHELDHAHIVIASLEAASVAQARTWLATHTPSNL